MVSEAAEPTCFFEASIENDGVIIKTDGKKMDLDYATELLEHLIVQLKRRSKYVASFNPVAETPAQTE
jgi:hypothetical protein